MREMVHRNSGNSGSVANAGIRGECPARARMQMHPDVRCIIRTTVPFYPRVHLIVKFHGLESVIRDIHALPLFITRNDA
jgi:hypothetical protein